MSETTGQLTIEDFGELSPKQQATRAAMSEAKEELGKLKTKLRNHIRMLKKKRNDALVPSAKAALTLEIAKFEKQFRDADFVSLNAMSDSELAIQAHYRKLIGWDAIMQKHGLS